MPGVGGREGIAGEHPGPVRIDHAQPRPCSDETSIVLSTDGEFYRFDRPINDESVSVRGTAGVTWDIATAVQLAATSTAGATPRERWFVNGLVRLVLGYHVDVGQQVLP